MALFIPPRNWNFRLIKMTSVDDYHTSLMAKKEKLRKDADSSTVKLVMNGFKTTGIAIAVWLWGYLGMSVAWIFVVLFFHIVSGEVSKQIKSKRKFALHSMNSEKKAILSRVDERQSWVSNFSAVQCRSKNKMTFSFCHRFIFLSWSVLNG